jgi:ACT domain-containing protein
MVKLHAQLEDVVGEICKLRQSCADKRADIDDLTQTIAGLKSSSLDLMAETEAVSKKVSTL